MGLKREQALIYVQNRWHMPIDNIYISDMTRRNNHYMLKSVFRSMRPCSTRSEPYILSLDHNLFSTPYFPRRHRSYTFLNIMVSVSMGSHSSDMIISNFLFV